MPSSIGIARDGGLGPDAFPDVPFPVGPLRVMLQAMRALPLFATALFALGLACSGQGPSAPPPPPAPDDASSGTPAPVAGGDPAAIAPAPKFPQPAVAGCSVGPPQVSLSKGVFTATVCPNVEARDTIYVGVTVQDGNGARKDLPYVTVPLDQRGKPVTISEEIPREYVRYVVGIWAQEIDCDADYDLGGGCKRFGKGLEDNVWMWPEWRDSDLSFEEIVPIRVQVLDSGGGAALVKQIRGSIEGIRPAQYEVLPGAPWPIVDGGTAQKQRDHIEILYKADRFRPLADRIRASLPTDNHVVVTAWEEAPEALVVAVGK